MNNKYVIRSDSNLYASVCDYLRKEMGFDILTLNTAENTHNNIKSKKDILSEFIKNIGKMLRCTKQLKNAETIIQIGTLYNILLLILSKLRIVKCNRIFWWAFFIHDPKNVHRLSVLLKLLYTNKTKFVVFSKYEKQYYASALNIDINSFVYLPYGNWKPEEHLPYHTNSCGREADYYFSGGYSNRDYIALIEAWKKIDAKLIIIASGNNTDLIRYMEKGLANNITVLFDQDSSTFDQYLSNAKACILPFKYNTGASGQSVSLRCMRLNKLMIATETDVISEYIKHEISGFIIKDLNTELAPIIRRISEDKNLCQKLLFESQKIYETHFSYSVITEELKRIIQ